MDKDKVRDVLLYLEDAGWSDLIDGRWKDKVTKEIKEKFPDITDEVLNYVLDLVLVW